MPRGGRLGADLSLVNGEGKLVARGRAGSPVCTYYKPTVHFLQDLLLIERHGLPFPLLDSLLLQLFAGVHLACCPHLAGAHL